jgi:predicted acyltransferase
LSSTTIDETHGRLVSLDAFRGFTIAAMVLVNNPGDWSNLYPQLAHAKWHGWTFTDWIFPFFLFICGVSMALSLSRKASASKPALMLDLWRRAAIILLIGLTLNFIPNLSFETLRIPGVLQRIALCTALAAPIVLYFGLRGQCLWIVGLLTFYSVVMLIVPVPDVNGVMAAGALEPGRDVGAFVDRWLLSGHLWASAKTWDPEGVFSTLPALCTMLLGVLTGRWLLSDAPRADKTVWMMVIGLLSLWIGAMIDATFMPINKPLWTSSYVFFMHGWGLLLFAVFYWLIDGTASRSVRNRARAALLPMTIYGMNALFIFAISGLIAKLLNATKFAQPDGSAVSLKAILFAPLKALSLSPVNTSLLFAILFNLVMFAIAWAMWKRRWFVKV